ncbi:MAG TPA: hypothetical protein VFE31_04805 [Opitutaceae bacterium]|jgi:hypothetical protein|nr:hypothetical protein [Opitutaceae bacterium]
MAPELHGQEPDRFLAFVEERQELIGGGGMVLAVLGGIFFWVMVFVLNFRH